ncbi:RNA polymerase subunit sigma-70 [Blastopirellula marina]|uniref:RNA polymerase subunit sigma-70 n=1 Tax=Blastopirellula marina TaxID=124 RepID=A0A2S8FF13_9BACT|nr:MULTISPECIES: sigma-70 family RNA polymerase sigma factor [Pirellulaceae]PQO30746.1 RNA polymerase subunit sigma-70 [Blastopirellula marina]RCS50883.1 RNA polymerase subunit sigma-70 [Bremerella cremea]
MDSPEVDIARNAFVEKFAANQQRIFAFVVSLAPGWNEAEDIFQRVSVVLWRKWDEYDQEKEFQGWALGVARLEVLKHMSDVRRRREIIDIDAIKAVEARTLQVADEVGDRMAALRDCMLKLPHDQRSLVERCYAGIEKIKDIADTLELTSNSLYSRLKRIREALHECIDRKMAAEEL